MTFQSGFSLTGWHITAIRIVADIVCFLLGSVHQPLQRSKNSTSTSTHRPPCAQPTLKMQNKQDRAVKDFPYDGSQPFGSTPESLSRNLALNFPDKESLRAGHHRGLLVGEKWPRSGQAETATTNAAWEHHYSTVCVRIFVWVVINN